MTNRNFGQIVQGPMTPDGPSVDDLRAQMHGSQGAGAFTFRDSQGPATASVTNGQETRQGDGTVTDDEIEKYRLAATASGQRAMPDARSFVERRDPTTGVATRTYDDGRTEEVDEQARQKPGRVRGRA
ncbi:hypothetical protein QBA37_25840 [Streptomyces silvae]|uniref:Uncharacterized protein n=1 Tax=Streptomyces silvae TaxID=2803812 RepID=A0ABU8A897_9ACTN